MPIAHGCHSHIQRLVEIPKNVVDVFEANAEAHEIIRHAGADLLVGRELRMRGAGWVNCQRLGIADVGHMAEHLQVVDELSTCFTPTLNAEANQ